jgi:hypothetical protein
MAMMMRLDWIFISLVLSWFFAVLGWLCCWISGVFLLFSGAKSLQWGEELVEISLHVRGSAGEACTLFRSIGPGVFR